MPDSSLTVDKKKKKKKGFKSPNTYVILFFAIVFIAILSWCIPGGAYDLNEAGQAISGTYHIVASNPQGLWDIFLAPIYGMIGSDQMTGAIAICLVIMLFGSFLEMMDETGAVKVGIKMITARSQNNMHFLIAILVCVMAFFGTLQGSYEEGIVYFMMFIPAIMALGLDTMVGVMIVVFGLTVGCLASTINPFAVGIASDIAGVSSGDGLGMRVILLIVLTTMVIFIICRYADKVKAHPEKSMQFFRREQDLIEFPVSEEKELFLTKQQKAALVMFVLMFAIMITSLIPWTSINPNFTFFDDFAAWIGYTPILMTVFGADITPFGSWYFPELSMLLIVMSIITGFIMHYDITKTIDIILRGAAGLLPTAFVVPLARGIQVVMDSGQITPTILHFGETTLSALPPFAFVIAALVFYFIIACLIPSSTGLAAATMAIMAALSRFAEVDPAIMVTIFCMALGLAKMISPTSIVVMTCTQAAHISYIGWVKKAAPIVGILFATCCVFLVVAVAIS